MACDIFNFFATKCDTIVVISKPGINQLQDNGTVLQFCIKMIKMSK